MAGALRSMAEDYHQLNNRVQAQQAFDDSLTLWQKVKAKAQVADLVQYMTERGYTVKPEP
jgi:hypothetical protein